MLKRFVSVLILSFIVTALHAEKSVSVTIDPLTCRWTFGNHEPISMYRRGGHRLTGGIEGSSEWLKEWHNWFDSEECPKLMQDLGLNILHSRFYKGMGWEFESKDFPNVKRFVNNCHKHGIRVLAYVQFSTLYYETMLEEIPDLESWAAIDKNGRKFTYHGNAYYRWMPCANNPKLEAYLKKVIKIALIDGGFDGIMFDNANAVDCHCPRCTKLFRERLSKIPNPEQRFGIPTTKHVRPPIPRKKFGEIQDPIYQEWIRFRSEGHTALYRRLYLHAKSCKPSAIVSANICTLRQSNKAAAHALNIPDLTDCFDLFISQSGNAPGISGDCIINRVRELKLADVLNTPVLALCDEDAGISDEAESKYLLPLMEDAVFGGIPTDRTVMKADRQMVCPELVAFRRPLLERFNKTLSDNHEAFASPSYAPIQLLYSRESMMYSEKAYQAVLSAEEILLRNHLPYGLLPTTDREQLKIPSECKVLLVCDQRCLSKGQIAALIKYAKDGGRLIVTGASGEYDQEYHQRKENPLTKALVKVDTVICRSEVDSASIKSTGWTLKVGKPTNGGKRLLKDISKLWQPEINIQAPETVLAEMKHSANATYIHLVNYAAPPVKKGVRIIISKGKYKCTFAAPMENRPTENLAAKESGNNTESVELPAFKGYALIRIKNK